MTEEEFKRLAAAYGGDLARWPEHLRSEAAAAARHVPHLGSLLQREYAFDECLHAAAPEVMAERADAAIAAVAGAIARQQGAAGYRSRLWRAAPLAFAVCAVLGFTLGFAMSSMVSPETPPQDAIAFLAGGGGDLGFLTR
jgi:hypothetical protein